MAYVVLLSVLEGRRTALVKKTSVFVLFTSTASFAAAALTQYLGVYLLGRSYGPLHSRSELLKKNRLNHPPQ